MPPLHGRTPRGSEGDRFLRPSCDGTDTGQAARTEQMSVDSGAENPPFTCVNTK
jgi:hypothetical protein